MFKLEGSFESVRQLLEADAKSPMPDDDLDTELWLLLTRQIHAPRDLRRMPESVATYFASRYLQWEVGNGGFAQAAESIPEWFELAETGYIARGKPKSAAIIHRARSLLVAGDEAGLEGLDAEIPTDEWEIDTERVAFVREHRTEFQSIR